MYPLKDLREIETEAIKAVNQRLTHSYGRDRIKRTSIVSSDLTTIASMPVYSIKAAAEIIVKPSGFLFNEQTSTIYLELKFHAQTGQLVGFEASPMNGEYEG